MGGGLIDGGFLDGGGGWGAEFGLGTPPGIGILGGVVSFGICAGGRTPGGPIPGRLLGGGGGPPGRLPGSGGPPLD